MLSILKYPLEMGTRTNAYSFSYFYRSNIEVSSRNGDENFTPFNLLPPSASNIEVSSRNGDENCILHRYILSLFQKLKYPLEMGTRTAANLVIVIFSF